MCGGVFQFPLDCAFPELNARSSMEHGSTLRWSPQQLDKMWAKYSSFEKSSPSWWSPEKEPPMLDPWPMPRAETDTSEVLKVFGAYLHLKGNGKEHHTSKYTLLKKEETLIVRRGQPFTISLECDRDYSKKKDVISLLFYLKGVKKPKHGNNTMIFLPLAPAPKEKAPHKWSAKVVGKPKDAPPKPKDNRTYITMEVTTSATSYVGEWLLQVDMNLLSDKSKASTFKVEKPIMMLFNAWNEEDSVYMKDSSLKQQYVLKDEGVIFMGTTDEWFPNPWTYEQFSPGILECCWLMLSNGKIKVYERNDPIKITRLFSATVNAENGILEGRWSGSYKDGVSPMAWNGSAKIIQQYVQTGKSVKYGQCWVFAGVLTTLCRGLGIPTRTVTCFNAGHDSDHTLTIDTFVNSDAEETFSKDMTWNYHVWNEAWMTRPDLEKTPDGKKYHGWQVIDSTPQEKSLGIFRLGPCSVAAVKKGEVLLKYDVPYVLGEVNADEVKWLDRGKSQAKKALEWDETYVGQCISTQQAGSYGREDITDTYKDKEKTKEERNIMKWAWRELGDVFPRFEKNNEKAGVSFKLDSQKDVTIGEDFKIRLHINNKSEQKNLKVEVALTLNSTSYTDEKLGKVKQEKYEKTIGKDEQEIVMEVKYKEYEKLVKDQGYLSVSVVASVPDLNYDEFIKKSFRVKTPSVEFSAEGDRKVGKKLKVTTQMKNPLDKPLSKAYMLLVGIGIGEGQKHAFRGGAKPGETLSHTFIVEPDRSGSIFLAAKFWSPELQFAQGYHVVSIQ